MKSNETVNRILGVGEEMTLLDCLQLTSQIFQSLKSQSSPLSEIQTLFCRLDLRLSRLLLDGNYNLSPAERAEVANLAARCSRHLISRGSATLILDPSGRLNFHA